MTNTTVESDGGKNSSKNYIDSIKYFDDYKTTELSQLGKLIFLLLSSQVYIMKY